MLDDVALDDWFQLLDAIEVPSDAEYLYDATTEHGMLRRCNLRRYLHLMARKEPTLMLIGEAPGHRGTAVTGVPFMSVRQTCAVPGLLTGDAAGDGFHIPRVEGSVWEATSGAMWQTLSKLLDPVPLLWAAYPNHPFEAGDSRSNRKPRPNEVRDGIGIALALARLFDIERVVAVGRVAQEALSAQGVDVASVRHPARGGARQFEDQLTGLLELAAT
jgi:hypothetical protein